MKLLANALSAFRIGLFNLIILFLFAHHSYGEKLNIVIDTDQTIGEINPLLFGMHITGYSHSYKGKIRVHSSNYGDGIWNPRTMQPVPEVIDLLKVAGITLARFPNGTSSTFYDWKQTIGPYKQRPNFLFGVDEFMKACGELGAEAIYVLPYFKGNSQDAADLVEYLNAPNDGSNPGGGIKWASERAKNGHMEPYGVKYFELGNEINYGRPRNKIPPADPEIYANKYLEYSKKMKTIDPSIKLGAVTVNSRGVFGIYGWNNKLFEVAGHAIDFLIEHTYYPNYTANDEKVDANKLISGGLNALTKIDEYYKSLSAHFKKVTARNNVPIAVTEFNARFVQNKRNKPVPLRHSLGTALINAGIIQILLKPENNILLANNLQNIIGYWGLISNDLYMKNRGRYTRRPTYYVLEMFSKYFAKDLLAVKVSASGEHSIPSERANLLSQIKWDSRFFSGADVTINNDNVEIHFPKTLDRSFNGLKKKVSVKPNTIYRLSGYLKADDLIAYEGLYLVIMDSRKSHKARSAAATERVWGTTNWKYVETEFLTLSDASNATIIISRNNKHGPVKGRAYVRDVTLTETDGIPKGSDVLSVSASRGASHNALHLMVLNKNVYADIDATIEINEHKMIKSARAWTLHGPTAWATNEKNPENVTIKSDKLEIRDKNRLDYRFPAHSLTAIEFEVN